jgi:hypothetical protein
MMSQTSLSPQVNQFAYDVAHPDDLNNKTVRLLAASILRSRYLERADRELRNSICRTATIETVDHM